MMVKMGGEVREGGGVGENCPFISNFASFTIMFKHILQSAFHLTKLATSLKKKKSKAKK